MPPWAAFEWKHSVAWLRSLSYSSYWLAQYEQVSMAERELRAFAESALGDYLTLALLMMIGVALVGIAVQRLSGDAPSPGITLAAGLTPAGLSSAAASWPTVVYSALDLRTL